MGGGLENIPESGGRGGAGESYIFRIWGKGGGCDISSRPLHDGCLNWNSPYEVV